MQQTTESSPDIHLTVNIGLITAWSRILEKLIVKEFTIFYGADLF
jgi:hypothetical protein